ncbi:hypothetical protein [Priestia megaterium]|uniref:hypothetical protein n=1 Tax=Priestia megaterium TaxID=1404 RepID=UPI00345B06F9
MVAIVISGILAYLLIGVLFVIWDCKDDHSGSWAMILPFLPIVAITWPYWLLRYIFVGNRN